MSAKCLSSFVFYKEFSYVSKLEVIQESEESLKMFKIWTYLSENNKVEPTGNGVTLNYMELQRLWPYLEKQEEHSFGEERKVEFGRTSHPLIFEISVEENENKQEMLLTSVALNCLLSSNDRFHTDKESKRVYRSFSKEFKSMVVKCAEESGVRKAAYQYNVAERQIYKWKKMSFGKLF
jgi:hypothetical protein